MQLPPPPGLVKRRVFLLLLPLAAIVSFGLGLHGIMTERVAPWAGVAGMVMGGMLALFTFAIRQWRESYETVERTMILVVALAMAATVLVGSIDHDEAHTTFELIRQGIWLPVVYGAAFLVLDPRWSAGLSWVLWVVLVVAASSHLLEPNGHTPAEIGTIVEILLSNAVIILVLMGVAWVIRSSERRAASMEFVAHTDTLTGLANRRSAEHKLEVEVERSLRYGRPLSVVLFDLDLFKTVNDTFGHDRGDRVLQRIPVTLEGRIRETDMLARWGGEEFLIISPEMDLERANLMAERFRRLIEQHDFETGWAMTASFGVAERQEHESAGDVVRRADEAMYAAKRNGRNAVWNSVMDGGAVRMQYVSSGAPTRTSDRLPPVVIPSPEHRTEGFTRTGESSGSDGASPVDRSEDEPPLER